jgi:hypothetical protein
MSVLIFLIVAGFLAAAVFAGYLYKGRRERRKAIDDILYDVNPLAVWTYSPDEWRQAVAEELSWGKPDDGATEIRISKTGAYFKNSRREHLIPLTDRTRVVTYAGYLGGEDSPLKLRTRWRVVTRDENGQERIKYYKDDFRIPVPVREKTAAQNVIDYFTKWIEANMGLYTKMVPDDEPISLFGKDSF